PHREAAWSFSAAASKEKTKRASAIACPARQAGQAMVARGHAKRAQHSLRLAAQGQRRLYRIAHSYRPANVRQRRPAPARLALDGVGQKCSSSSATKPWKLSATELRLLSDMSLRPGKWARSLPR